MSTAAPIAFFFSTSGHSGVDRCVRNLLPAITGRGHRIDLLHVRGHGPSTENLPAGVRVVDLGTRHTYSALPAVVRYLRQNRPVAMLSDKDRVNRTALLARWLAGVPTRLVLRSGTTISIDLAHRGAFERWLQRNSMGKLYRFADQVIVPAQDVADDLSRYTGLAREHIQVVPSPVVPASCFERNASHPDHPWLQPGEPPVVLGVGELCMRKDFAMLLRAFAQVRAQRDCRLLILGKGRQHDQLLALAASLGVAQDVCLAGFQPNPYDYMQHAALLAFSSRWEGLGFVLIEALALGTPVVSTDCPSGPREILHDGRYGPLVPVGDDQAMARAILDTLEQPLPPATLQQAARRYEIEAATDAYLTALGLPP